MSDFSGELKPRYCCCYCCGCLLFGAFSYKDSKIWVFTEKICVICIYVCAWIYTAITIQWRSCVFCTRISLAFWDICGRTLHTGGQELIAPASRGALRKIHIYTFKPPQRLLCSTAFISASVLSPQYSCLCVFSLDLPPLSLELLLALALSLSPLLPVCCQRFTISQPLSHSVNGLSQVFTHAFRLCRHIVVIVVAIAFP